MRTADLCTRTAVTIKGGSSLAEAAALMRQRHVGCLVVLDSANPTHPAGIITDRDIVVKAVAAEVDAKTISVDEVVSGRPLLVAHEDEPAADALRTMRRNGVRRLPVVDARGQLAGIVALDDFIESGSEALADMVEAIARERVREVASLQ